MMRKNERIEETVFAQSCVSGAQNSRAEHILCLIPLE